MMSNKEKSMIDFNDHSCLECGQYCMNRRSVGNHINRAHELTIETYVLKHYLGGVSPVCMCGCDMAVKWHKTQYYFCDFISGHNGSGFSATNQPKFTTEQIESRNEKIRNAYVDKGMEIKDKISISVRQALAEPEMKEKLSRAQKKIWANSDYSDRMRVIRKKTWADKHDELYKKIFTPEFSKKISEANMRRDLKRTSNEELSFRQWLMNALNDQTIDSIWINDPTDGTANYDAYVPSLNLLIEWDGTYYHGLDRNAEYTLGQMIHITNDFRKNRIAAASGHELIRLRGDLDLTTCKTIDDLKVRARHHQLANGEIVKDGMFRFTSDDQVIVSRERLIRLNESDIFPDAPGRTETEMKVLPVLMAFFREVVRARGWIYPHKTMDIKTALSQVADTVVDLTNTKISSLTSAGSDYLRSVFRSYWDVDAGPMRSFYDDARFANVLAYRLGLNNSKKYSYTLKDGVNVSCQETFDITPHNIRRGFIVQRAAVSWFKPSAAFNVYKRFLGDNQTPVVWDPSCGFGARLLGFAAAYPKGTYIGTDPATRTFADLGSLQSELSNVCTDLNVQLFCCGSENFKLNRKVDLVFTSPPYFDKEKYFDEETQCWKMFSDSDNWVKGYLVPTLSTAAANLKPGGRIVLNVSDSLRDMILSAASSVNLRLVDELELIVGRDHFAKRLGKSTTRSEPILVFSV